MSSLQKFHRRTFTGGGVVVTWPPSAIGMGDATHGFWLGTAGDGTSKLIVAPKSTATQIAWGSSGSIRGTTSVVDGLANTNTLLALGQAAHPAAYHCRTLTTGGYNTWYLPAINELITMVLNKTATPFSTTDSFHNQAHMSSTEASGGYVKGSYMNGSAIASWTSNQKAVGDYYWKRAVRRY